MAKEKGIQVLMIEDELADMVLVNCELRTGGLACSIKRVESKEDFLHEQEQESPNLILSDHGLPSFDGFTALAIARERCPDVPFMFVISASISTWSSPTGFVPGPCRSFSRDN